MCVNGKIPIQIQVVRWNTRLATSSFFGERLGFVADYAKYYVQCDIYIEHTFISEIVKSY